MNILWLRKQGVGEDFMVEVVKKIFELKNIEFIVLVKNIFF